MGLIEKIKFEVRMAHARWRVRRFLKNRPVTPYDPFGQHHPADAEGPNPRNQDSPEGYADAADFQPARSEEMTRALAEALDDKLPPDPAPDPTAKVELNPIIATMRVTVHSSNQSPEMSRALAVAGITDWDSSALASVPKAASDPNPELDVGEQTPADKPPLIWEPSQEDIRTMAQAIDGSVRPPGASTANHMVLSFTPRNSVSSQYNPASQHSCTFSPMAPPFYPGNHDSSQPSDTLSQPSTTPSTASDSSEHRVVVLEDSLPPVMNGVRPSEPAYAEESAIPKVKLPPHPRPGTPRQEFSPRRTTVHHSPTGGPDNLIDFGRIVVDGQKEKQRRNTS